MLLSVFFIFNFYEKKILDVIRESKNGKLIFKILLQNLSRNMNFFILCKIIVEYKISLTELKKCDKYVTGATKTNKNEYIYFIFDR